MTAIGSWVGGVAKCPNTLCLCTSLPLLVNNKGDVENGVTSSDQPNAAAVASTSLLVLGMGELGQLGLGEDVMERKKATPVGGVLERKNIIQVVCGGIHTVTLIEGGQVCNNADVVIRF